jgi:hypothetical protein
MLKNVVYLVVASVVLLLVVASCSGSSTAPDNALDAQLSADSDSTVFPMKAPEIPLEKGTTTHEGAHGSVYIDPEPDVFPDEGWVVDPASFTMTFGQNYDYGTAELVEEGSQWYVHYTLTDEAIAAGWMYCDAHVGIFADEPNPNKDGKPGQYPYKWDAEGDHGEFMTEVMLPLGDFMPQDFEPDFCLTIHASICMWGITGYDDLGEPIYGVVDEETGWGGPWTDEWSKRWGGWVCTTAKEYKARTFQPMDRVYNASHSYGNLAYWKVTFTPDGNYPFYPFANNGNPWPGWCTDPTGFRNGLNCRAISSYDTVLDGTYAESDHYDLISWMINERNDPTSPYYNYYYGYFQRAVWYFKYGNAGGMHLGSGGPGANYAVTHPMVAQLIADAKAYGENYVPGPGEYYAVLLIPLDADGNLQFGTSQVNIIEVDP